ncbi:MAG: ATP synthase F1 subunit delta [Candidatus Omnitrophota bacterium]
MINKIAVKRYADAFVGLTKERVGLKRGLADMIAFRDLLKGETGLGKFLSSQQISYAEKAGFIDQVFGADLTEEFREFLKLLLRKGRIGAIADMIDYALLTYSQEGAIEVSIASAFALEAEEERLLERKLEEKFKKKFKYCVGIKPGLLGGVQVTIGNTVIDGSVRRRLDELKEKLAALRV